MPDLLPITDAEIDDVIKVAPEGVSLDPTKTQGRNHRSLVKRIRDYFAQEVSKKLDKTGGGVGKLAIQEKQSVQAGYMGACEDLFPGYSIFYVSGNADHEAADTWRFRTNGTDNGGTVLVYCKARISGSGPLVGLMMFQIDVQTGYLLPGSQDQVLTNAQMMDLAKPVGGDKADKDLSINTQTASYTLALSDRGNMVRMNVASANTLTVPPNSAVAFPVGTQLVISQAGAGQTTIVAGSGVTINASGAKMKLTSQWSGATLVQVSADVWTLFGDLTA